jgi:hypothetical protein
VGLRIALSLGAVCLMATLVLATLPAPAAMGLPPPGTERIVLYGDSLVSEAGQDFAFLAALSGASVQVHTFPGTAPCDFFASMAADAQDWRPTVAMLAFSGDAFTPCMGGVQIATPQYYTAYEHDTQTAISIFRSVGTKVILVGLPADASASLTQNSSALNQIYQALSKDNPGVTFDDAGEAVTESGRFTWTLPCLSGEPCTGPDGTNIVRAPDGVHFCPNGETTLTAGFEECDVYSSGAFRFASAMVASALGSPDLSKTVSNPSAPCRSEPVQARRKTAERKPRATTKECRTRRRPVRCAGPAARGCHPPRA